MFALIFAHVLLTLTEEEHSVPLALDNQLFKSERSACRC